MAELHTIPLKAGDPAPNFDALDHMGQRHRLEDYRGRQVVLYFYPKDNTPGCTREACDFRDLHRDLEKAGAVVLGVSADPPRSHVKFAEKMELPFPLLLDEDRKVIEAYGVWGTKKFMGRTFDGIHRATFLIGADGMLRQVWPKVKVDGHAREVLDQVHTPV